jgi:ACS family tartrate transporter-like MFS transporter
MPVTTTMTSTGSLRVSDETAIGNRTIRKLKIRLLPWLFLLFVVAYIDRINIGFAALTMNHELGISGRQFGIAAGIFFFGYFIFEIPSNLLLHKIGARIWMARILLTWGILAMATGLVRNLHQLYVVRFLLGVAEAGYFPGIILYLTYWFRRSERSRAVALFAAAVPIASIVGAPISGAILDHFHWMGVSSWRWLLILEGLPAIVCGLLTYFVLPSWPSEARFLTPEEREWLRAELADEEQQKLERHDYSVLQALVSGRVWYLIAINFGMMIGLYALIFWTPQLLKSFSGLYSNSTVGLLVMFPHLVGLVAMILVSRSSDRHLERAYHAGVPGLVAGAALLLLGWFHSPMVVVALLSLLAAGVYSFLSPFWAIPSEFLAGFAAAAGIGLMNSFANLGGFVGPYLVGVMSGWTGGIHSGLALAGIPLVISGSLLLLLSKEARAHRISAATED